MLVSTHSRLKAAGLKPYDDVANLVVSTHSRLKAAGKLKTAGNIHPSFQHTAA